MSKVDEAYAKMMEAANLLGEDNIELEKIKKRIQDRKAILDELNIQLRIAQHDAELLKCN